MNTETFNAESACGMLAWALYQLTRDSEMSYIGANIVYADFAPIVNGKRERLREPIPCSPEQAYGALRSLERRCMTESNREMCKRLADALEVLVDMETDGADIDAETDVKLH